MGIARRVAVAFTAAAATGTLSLAVVNMASSGAEPEVFCRAGYPGGSGGDGGLSEGGNGGYARGGNGGRGGSGTLPICNQNTNGGWVEDDAPLSASPSGGSHFSNSNWEWGVVDKWDGDDDNGPRRNSWVFED